MILNQFQKLHPILIKRCKIENKELLINNIKLYKMIMNIILIKKMLLLIIQYAMIIHIKIAPD